MIVGEAFSFGTMGRGSVSTANYSDQDGAEMFGFGLNSKLPWEGSVDVFGLGDGDGGCSCPVLNAKNVSMLVAGSLISWFGLKGAGPGWNLAARLTGGFIAGYGLVDIGSGIYKKHLKAATPQAAPVPQATPAPDQSKDLMGLGSEWYAPTPTNAYLNRFANALRTTCKCGSGMGECYSCL